MTTESLLPRKQKSTNGPYPRLVESGGYSETFIFSTNKLNDSMSMVVLEKVNPRLAKKLHAFYGNRCSKHIVCCHSHSQMNPFRANALSFFKAHLMYLVQLGLPSVPFQIFHKALCSFLYSRLYPTCSVSLTLLVYTLLIIPDE